MCGIIGYLGTDNAKDQILTSLKKIEYRGYDSAGVAVITSSGSIERSRTKGGIDALEPVAQNLPEASVGIGHTRWATHGEPSEANAHPHSSENFTLVHNGIIENYQQLLDKLNQQKKVTRSSQTDTEVLVHLIEHHYQKTGDAKKAILTSLKSVSGTFGLAVLHKDDPDTL